MTWREAPAGLSKEQGVENGKKELFREYGIIEKEKKSKQVVYKICCFSES